MASTDDLRDVGLALVVLRSLPHPRWSQAELSRQSGVEKGLISDYELGKTRPSRKTLARLAEAVGVDLSFFDRLLPLCRGIRLAYEHGLHKQEASTEADSGRLLEERIAGAVLEGMAPFLLQLPHQGRERVPRPEDRTWGEETWGKLKALPEEDQRLTVEVLLGDERSWALAERLCQASDSAAAEGASEALRLARLAARIADHSPGPVHWRLRFRGWCEPFLANALRAGGGRETGPAGSD